METVQEAPLLEIVEQLCGQLFHNFKHGTYIFYKGYGYGSSMLPHSFIGSNPQQFSVWETGVEEEPI